MSSIIRHALGLASLFLWAETLAAQMQQPRGMTTNNPGQNSAATLRDRPSQSEEGQRPTDRNRAGQAFALVDYFDYPATASLMEGEELMLGIGNEALWECLETRAARVALVSNRQHASR